MTEEMRKFNNKMVELSQSTDIETIHGEADQALLDYLLATGHGEVVESYQLLKSSVGGFWYA